MSAICPECDSPIDVDEFDVDIGDELTCSECGSLLRVASDSPLEFEIADEEDDLDDEEEEEETSTRKRRTTTTMMTTRTTTIKSTTSSVLADKGRRLHDILAGYESVLIAFSGGVDSAYLAIAAAAALGDRAPRGHRRQPELSRYASAARAVDRARLRLRARSDSHRGARSARVSRQSREPLLLLQGRAVWLAGGARRRARSCRRRRRQQRRRSRRLSSRPPGGARARRAQPARRSRSDQGRHPRAGARRRDSRAGMSRPRRACRRVFRTAVKSRTSVLRQIEQAEAAVRDARLPGVPRPPPRHGGAPRDRPIGNAARARSGSQRAA